MAKNVYVLRHFDGEKPTRVEAVILAENRYEAMSLADDYREAHEMPLTHEEEVSDVIEAFEDDDVEGVFLT